MVLPFSSCLAAHTAHTVLCICFAVQDVCHLHFVSHLFPSFSARLQPALLCPSLLPCSSMPCLKPATVSAPEYAALGWLRGGAWGGGLVLSPPGPYQVCLLMCMRRLVVALLLLTCLRPSLVPRQTNLLLDSCSLSMNCIES